MIRSKATTWLFAVGLFGSPAAFAQDPVMSLGTGINYSSGNYGTANRTTITSVPLIGRYETGPWAFKLTVPYIRISGSSTVIPGIGLTANTNPTGRGGAGVVVAPVTASSTASGLGDIVAAATYNVYNNAASKVGIDLTGKVKLPTADRDKGLGTGEADYSFQVDAFRQFDRFTLFGGLGYNFLGSSSFIQLNDVWNASLGGSYKIDDMRSAGISFDAREKVSSTSSPLRELTAFYVHKFDHKWKGQVYYLKGLSDGSPDWGAGATVTYTF